MRNLASIQRIKALDPIEGADQIEKATVLGWQLVVKKNEFKAGDLCVYCEIDSLMPQTPEFEFLKLRGMRIKTIRLRGQISQGICFPLSLVEKYGLHPSDMVEGQDVTEALGIARYEPPVPANLAGEVKGSFPGFMPKTDETRVQVLQPVLDKYKGTLCYITEKLDGSSVTYYFKDGQFGVCGRNLELRETEDSTLWKVARMLYIESKLRSLGMNCCIQGEMIGENIQGNKYKLKGQTAKFFNFFDIDAYRYAGYAEFKSKMDTLDLETTPVLSDNYILENVIEALVKMSVGKSGLNPDVWREGIVIRPLTEIIDQTDGKNFLNQGRVSFKVINPEFLLRHGE